ncbi:MAG: hypothetical protein WC025_03480 [Candidatus Magasanikbacteria bacterium]
MFEKTRLSQIIDPLRSQFMIMKECLVCKREISDKQIKIVGESDNSYTLHLSCTYCDNALVLLASVNNIGVGLVCMMSDLTYDDAKRLFEKAPIGADSLLDAYQVIQNISFNKYLISKK